MKIIESLTKASSPAECYRLQILIENICTPAELANISSKSDRFSPAVQQWLSIVDASMRKGNEQIIPFTREAYVPDTDFYRNRRPTEGTRNLVINFCGGYPYRPLSMPMAVFLQHMPGEGHDILNLRDPLRTCFLGRKQEHPHKLVELVNKIRRDFINDYENIFCCGLSSGGFATLMCGELIGAKKTLVFSGIHPHDARRADEDLSSSISEKLDYLEGVLRDNSGNSDIVMVYGSQNARDEHNTLELKKHFKASRMQVTAIENISHHLMPIVLLKEGKLKNFLDVFLFGNETAIQ